MPSYEPWQKTLIIRLQTYHAVMTLCVMFAVLSWYSTYFRHVPAADV